MYADISPFKKIFHFLPVLPVYIVITTVTISVTVYFIQNDHFTPFPKILFGGIFYIFALMVIYTHTLSMITSPGHVQYGFRNPEGNRANADDPNISLGHLFCKKCKNERPPRAHHCKTCHKCTLKMDHHCPWIANCVGFKNQKFFYQFLFFATFGDLLGFFLILSSLMSPEEKTRGQVHSNNKPLENVWDIIREMWSPIMIIISSTLAIAMTLAIGLLFYVQTKMIIYNQTTVESHIFSDVTVNPWYYESKLHNFKTVMGESFIEWITPVFKPNKFNNGLSFYTPKNIALAEIHTSARNTYLQLGDLESHDAGHIIDGSNHLSITNRINL